LSQELAENVTSVARTAAVGNILEIICRSTGMGFAVLVRAMRGRWIACAVRDEMGLGLVPGDEAPFIDSLCNEARAMDGAVYGGQLAAQEFHRRYPAPRRYSFQSCISVPVPGRNGAFHWALCAVDRRPMQVDESHLAGLFTLFAEQLAHILELRDELTMRGQLDQSARAAAGAGAGLLPLSD
jgi:hypothetical protein